MYFLDLIGSMVDFLKSRLNWLMALFAQFVAVDKGIA